MFLFKFYQKGGAPGTKELGIFDPSCLSNCKSLKDLKLEGKNVLAVFPEKTPEIIRSLNNLANVKAVRATYLNVFDIMNADAIVMTADTVKVAENWLLRKENA